MSLKPHIKEEKHTHEASSLFGNEIILGSLIAILSVMTALTSFQGSAADSKQNEHEILGMQ